MAEIVTYSWLVGFVCFVLATLLLRLYKIVWRVDSRGHNLPPGSTGWPLIGESIGFIRGINSSSQPRQFIQDRELRYGQIFRSNLFGRSRMVVSVDPEFNKHILQHEGRLFQSNYPRPFRNLIGKFGLLSVHGDLQKKLHGTAVNFLRSEKLSVDFMEGIQNVMQTTFAQWQAKREIHLQEECHQLALNLIAKQLLGLSPSKETEEICKAFGDFCKGVVSVPIRIPGTTYARGLKAREFLIKKIYEGIKHRRQHPEAAHNDFLTELLKEDIFSEEVIKKFYEGIKHRRQHPEAVHNDFLTELLKEDIFSEEVIADFILFLLLAGHETVSSSMVLAIKFLTDCPQALQELKAEHDALLERKGSPRNQKLTWDDYQSMKFSQCVINETLRVGNPALAVCREAKEDIKINGGFVIPRGWTVLVLLTGTHLDDKYHSSALTFDPWRWQQKLQNQELSKNASFMPFGGGPRLCPGLHLAKLELALFLHSFVTKFRWEALQDDRISHFPVSRLTKGFPIRLYLQEQMDD